MEDIEGIKTDPMIGDILNKLKNAGEARIVNESKPVVIEKAAEDKQEEIIDNVVDENNVSNNDDAVDTSVDVVQDTTCITDDCDLILPWLNASDLDNELLHYATLDENGKLQYHSINLGKSDNEIAALKLSDNYVCDIDYYKSKHYVLYITQECDNTGGDCSLYYNFTVLTDLGTAKFTARGLDLTYPDSDSNLSKWFEDASNYVILSNPSYMPNPDCDNDLIRDYKYDVITMNTPGVFTLDSIDNEDPNYNVMIKIKEEFRMIPLDRVLGCLKYYSTSKLKTIGDFRSFICKYFDVIV